MPNTLHYPHWARAVATVSLLFLALQQTCPVAAAADQQQKLELSTNLNVTRNLNVEGSAIADAHKTAKKALTVDDAAAVAAPPKPVEGEKEVVISERPGPPVPATANKEINEHKDVDHIRQPAASKELGIEPVDEVHIQQSKFNLLNDNMDFPETYTAVFYIMVGITSSAILILVLRVYRLRLSRAERKYGVQGDRANQELTPLPMAIEDVNSDEEDHTLFELVQI
ncbi:uncharacterized protein LOC115620041 isoform X2 [Scaptodrosophila lebanonensis]|uniref:Uncharacterized protein LOC115620041 isoform X2 n=1 Tax=Drosophila lebanonensis TaxID=7225 RepID=A0A6J2T188_DROLE|nr:uncharacterized protein LOC115620041 isoform X2 [Scaptodrosophila lebanonensis]